MSNNWTSADLPGPEELRDVVDGDITKREAVAMLYVVSHHLNTHHPKRDDALLYRAEAAERERDKATDQWKKWEHKAGQRDELLIRTEAARDAAVERAEQAETEFEKAKNSTLMQLDWAGFQCGEEYQDLVERAEQAEREVSTWRTSTESAHSDFLQAAHDRDEWKARAEAAERAHRAEEHRNTILIRERDGRGELLDEIAEAVYGPPPGDGWHEWDDLAGKVRELVARTAPSVTRDEIEAALMRADLTDSGRDIIDRHTDAICDLLGIEAEQAVDPVEELAAQIEAASRAAIRQMFDDLTAATVPGLDAGVVEEMMDITSESRRLARHVLGQEADQ